jgi:hypothetical protein
MTPAAEQALAADSPVMLKTERELALVLTDKTLRPNRLAPVDSR